MKKGEECLVAGNCCGACSTCKPIDERTKADGKKLRVYGTNYAALG